MQWHPLALKFPLIRDTDPAAWPEFVAGIKATKGIKSQPILFRVVNGERQGLDGRNREVACEELGIKPTYERVKVADDDVAEFIQRYNLRRRHMTAELRKPLVAELRAEGESTRVIAEKLGVSHTTVERDLADPTGTNVPVDDQKQGENGQSSPKTIVGRDGKARAATAPKKLCERCQRAGAAKDCPMCAELRTGKRKAKGPEPEPEADVTREQECKADESLKESVCRRIMEEVARLPGNDGWLQHQNRIGGIEAKAKALCESIRATKTPHVCHKCAGEGCRHCLGTGRLTTYAKEQLG